MSNSEWHRDQCVGAEIMARQEATRKLLTNQAKDFIRNSGGTEVTAEAIVQLKKIASAGPAQCQSFIAQLDAPARQQIFAAAWMGFVLALAIEQGDL